MQRFNPEAVDLAKLADRLRDALEPPVVGAIVGRTRIRDGVMLLLRCSQLEGEQIVDTMVTRGFLVRTEGPDGLVHWTVSER